MLSSRISFPHRAQRFFWSFSLCRKAEKSGLHLSAGYGPGFGATGSSWLGISRFICFSYPV